MKDDDDMGFDCVAWFQAHKAVHTMQQMGEGRKSF